MTQHLCTNRPDYDPEGTPEQREKWIEGDVPPCPHHGHSGAKQLGFTLGKADRRALDREAGVVGKQSTGGDFING